MASDIVDSLRPYFRGDTRNGKIGRVALAVYIVLGAASIVWGLSGGGRLDNDLNAQIDWDATGAQTALVIGNRGDSAWTEVLLMLDERFYHRLDGVPASETIAIPTHEFQDGYRIPRPDGMYAYERLTPRPPRSTAHLRPRYQPSRVRLSTAQGQVVTTVEAH